MGTAHLESIVRRPAQSLVTLARSIGLASALTGISRAALPRDLESDTWAATDALGRSLPAGPTDPPVEPRAIMIDGRIDDWAEVKPEFRDTIGDPVHRDHRGWGKTLHYANATGRNGIVASKVSFDDRTVSFYVRTNQNLTSPAQPNWMLLFIDADSDPKTGWLGYDLMANRRIADSSATVVG